MTIGVLNPKSGNLTSVCDMLDRLGRGYRVLEKPELEGISQILLPGQGRFGAVMGYLRQYGWEQPLLDWVAAKKPLMGICVGMQVLFESSEEDPGVAGLGIFKGGVRRLDAPKHPMIGWSKVHWREAPEKETKYREGAAYFVNSYGLHDHSESVATTTYGKSFCVAVARDNIIAFQFHPEKSGNWGRELMEQCLIT